ncbi:MAG: type II toxin-antitoxin system CcdA family antitoxin [Proteobacteria bacterium]|nr:type II toxin-antitoxin system CcdA family antitoxin [Pseudomonadota bacterium]
MRITVRGRAVSRSAATAQPPAPARKATNVTLPETLLQEARTLGINLSQACERGLLAAVAEQRRTRWLEENRHAIDAWNEHVEKHGVPLAAFRQF